MQRQNYQKVVSCARAKIEKDWVKLVIISKQCPPFPKLALVKLASDQLLQMLGLTA
jgi:hypothetical protein